MLDTDDELRHLVNEQVADQPARDMGFSILSWIRDHRGPDALQAAIRGFQTETEVYFRAPTADFDELKVEFSRLGYVEGIHFSVLSDGTTLKIHVPPARSRPKREVIRVRLADEGVAVRVFDAAKLYRVAIWDFAEKYFEVKPPAGATGCNVRGYNGVEVQFEVPGVEAPPWESLEPWRPEDIDV